MLDTKAQAKERTILLIPSVLNAGSQEPKCLAGLKLFLVSLIYIVPKERKVASITR